VITHYELIRELGRGSASVVYKAREASTHRIVAIKALDFSEFDRDAASEFKYRFMQAAESTGLLTHPNIVRIYDYGEENDLFYVTMEYLKGSNLGRYTQAEHLLPLREALNVIVQVADALDYAHAKGVLHGGLKPANIIWIRKAKKAKVTDFATTDIASFSKNKKGIGVDFPYYMSPEQLSGKKLDGRSDIFSIGVLLFELLTGQKPFAGDDISSLMLMIAKDKHPSAKTLNARVPQMVERIIDRALEKDLEKRYETAGQMASRLKEVIVRIDEILAQKTTNRSSQVKRIP
jgi:serine/threonine-protein kinase